MATGDLVTLAQVQSAYPGLLPDQVADLPALISALSYEISQRYPRVALKASYDETHDPGVSRVVSLKHRPVLGLLRVRSDMRPVLAIKYTGAGRRASVEVPNDGEADAPACSTLVLHEEIQGIASPDVVFNFAANPTLDDLAAAVNLIPVWTATVAPNVGTIAVTGDTASVDLEPTQGPKSAVVSPDSAGSVGASLWAYCVDVGDVQITDPLLGSVLLYRYRSQSYQYPAAVWGIDPRATTVRVQYTAGRLTVTPDVARAAIIAVGAALEATDKPGLVYSVKSDAYQYQLADPTYRLPETAERILSRYKNRRFY